MKKDIALFSTIITLILFSTLVFSASSKFNWEAVNFNANTSSQLQKRITQIASQTGGIVGVGVYDLRSRQGFYLNGNTRFPMASTYKVAMAVRLLQLVEAGKLDLRQLITIEPSDLVPGGSGVLAEQLYHPGVKVSLINLLQIMIRLSDNTATDKILSLVGGPKAVTQAMRKLGIKDMRIDRPTLLLLGDGFGVRKKIDALPKSQRTLKKITQILDNVSEKTQRAAVQDYETRKVDTTTPMAMVKLLQLIATEKALKPKYTKLLIQIMSKTETGENRLKGLMPKSVTVAHKTGTFERTANDVGFIIPKNSQDKIIVVVYVNANSKGEANSALAIARIAQVAYDYFSKSKKTDLTYLKKLLNSQINKLSHTKRYQHATWSVVVKNVSNGTFLFQKNAGRLLAPASVNKLFSTAAALHYLGANYHFKTPVYADGTIKNGTLYGRLILVGSGDFIFGARSVDSHQLEYPNYDHIFSNELPGITLTKGDPLSALNYLANAVYQAGIHKVDGNVEVDDRLFKSIKQRDVIRSPIMINDNIIDLVISPSKVDNSAKVQYRPKVSGFTIHNKVITNSSGKTDIHIRSSADGNTLTITGSIDKNSKNIIRSAPIKHPRAFSRQAFIDALRKAGVKIMTNKPIQYPAFNTYKSKSALVVYRSPAFSKYIKLILKVSHNTGADMLPLVIAAHQNQSTYTQGMRDIGLFLIDQVKLSPSAFSMLDASGGNGNYMAPEAMIQLLDYMKALPKPEFQVFFNALPVLGIDGSIADVGQNLAAKGKVYAKTGTEWEDNLANPNVSVITSKALAGYIKKDGQLLEFMVVVNNASLTSIAELHQFVADTVGIANMIYKYAPAPKRH